MNDKDVTVIFCECTNQFHDTGFLDRVKVGGKIRSIVHYQDFLIYLEKLPSLNKMWFSFCERKFNDCNIEIYFPLGKLGRDFNVSYDEFIPIKNFSKYPERSLQIFQQLIENVSHEEKSDHVKHFITIFRCFMPYTIPFPYKFNMHLTRGRKITIEIIEKICKTYTNSIKFV